MVVVSVATTDACGSAARGPNDVRADRVSAAAVWVDGRYDHELLLFPGSGRGRYETLVGPFAAGRHSVELRRSGFWNPSDCLRPDVPEVSVIDAAHPRHPLLRHAPVLELRADTVGEATDVPLFEYAEELADTGGRRLRYTVVFSNEDGGTQTRALLARWGRTTDIEQVYDAVVRDGRVVREEFQGPDHEIREFKGRRRGEAPVLLVATVNNMVTDRGRGTAVVRPVPERVDLATATRESTLDGRPWAYRVMQAEMTAEGRMAAAAPDEERWWRVAPDPREHCYMEARLTLDHAAAAAWVRTRRGQQLTSNYGRDSLAITRNGWVRTAIAVGANPGSEVEELGWSCLPLPGDAVRGSCVIEAARAFTFGPDWTIGANRIRPTTLTLRTGEEAAAPRSVAGAHPYS